MTNTTSVLGTRLRRAAGQLPLLVHALALVWHASRPWTVAWTVLLVLQGLLPVATVYLTRALVDGLTATPAATLDWATLRPTLGVVALLAGVLLLSEALRGLAAYVRTAQAELVQDHISRLIHEKSIAVDIRFYDSPDYYDRLHRARYEATSRPLSLLENLGSLLQNSLTFAAMAIVLIPYGWWLPAALIVSSLPAFYIVLGQRLRLHRWRLANTATERRAWYYFWLLTDRDTAAELRIFALGAHFQTLYQALRQPLRRERLHLAGEQGLVDFGAGAVGLLVTALTLAWMVVRTVAGALSLGDLAFFYAAFSQGQRLLRTLLDHAGEIYANSLFLGDLFEFLALPTQVTEPPAPQPAPAPLRQGVHFEQVSFRYPGSSRDALHDFTLTLPAGQITAIVGANGAGKSTLVKLLCRLHDPDQGRISLDGVDLRDLALADLRRQITVLFQEPVQYNDSAAANIGLGNLAAAPSLATIVAAAHAAGADTPIAALPDGYDSLLGKWFEGGVDLSVGEWQRIALARAYVRQAPLIVLDEPTSAMDPWAETDWLRRFQELARGRTALIITHRFTTAMYADTIHVMEGGAIVESGSHTALLHQGGRYAAAWRAQLRLRTGEPTAPQEPAA